MIIYTNYYESRAADKMFSILWPSFCLLIFTYFSFKYFLYFAWTPISGSLLFMLWPQADAKAGNPTNGKQKIVYENENENICGGVGKWTLPQTSSVTGFSKGKPHLGGKLTGRRSGFGNRHQSLGANPASTLS